MIMINVARQLRTRGFFVLILSLTAPFLASTMPLLQPSASHQSIVSCKGVHALCAFSTNCQLKKDKHNKSLVANCPCWETTGVNYFIVDAIKDKPLLTATKAKCTETSPCGLNEAPICKAMRDGTVPIDIANGQNIQHVQNNRIYSNISTTTEMFADTVSTFSWQAFCSAGQNPMPCEKKQWAQCMGATCQLAPLDVQAKGQKYICACTVLDSTFTSAAGNCGSDETILSGIPNPYELTMSQLPGYESVREA
eukprot:Awhi_evm1s13588